MSTAGTWPRECSARRRCPWEQRASYSFSILSITGTRESIGRIVRCTRRWVRPGRSDATPECFVYIHGWLEPGSWVEEAMIFPTLTRRLGVDALHIALPFHGTPKPAERAVLRRVLLHGGSRPFVRGHLCQALSATRESIIGWLRRQGYARVGVSRHQPRWLARDDARLPLAASGLRHPDRFPSSYR